METKGQKKPRKTPIYAVFGLISTAMIMTGLVSIGQIQYESALAFQTMFAAAIGFVGARL